MDKKVILAVAGAGKTYHICHAINPNKSNLILAFTNENVHNIIKELCLAYGNVPINTTVTTFDSFVYHMILPYEPSIAQHFKQSSFVSNGITTIAPPNLTIKENGKNVPNPQYIKKDKLRHYVTKHGQYYCETLSELLLQVKNGKQSLAKRIAARLNLFYDSVYIDEFQDFREYDYDLIVNLSKRLNNVLLVGDYYQHSVSGTNNSGKPFKKRTAEVSYAEFVDSIKKEGFIVDVDSLKKSRRCSADVCNFVKNKLGIDIASHDSHAGSIIWADDIATQILEDDKIIKLVNREASKYSFTSMNWSYSKGNTVDCACIILTDNFETLNSDTFSSKNIPISTLNKLYVAMTRSRGDLYLIKSSTFKKVKDSYIING